MFLLLVVVAVVVVVLLVQCSTFLTRTSTFCPFNGPGHCFLLQLIMLGQGCTPTRGRMASGTMTSASRWIGTYSNILIASLFLVLELKVLNSNMCLCMCLCMYVCCLQHERIAPRPRKGGGKEISSTKRVKRV